MAKLTQERLRQLRWFFAHLKQRRAAAGIHPLESSVPLTPKGAKALRIGTRAGKPALKESIVGVEPIRKPKIRKVPLKEGLQPALEAFSRGEVPVLQQDRRGIRVYEKEFGHLKDQQGRVRFFRNIRSAFDAWKAERAKRAGGGKILPMPPKPKQ